MNNKTSKLLVALVSVICGFYFINSFVLGHFFTSPRTVRLDILQGFLIGYGLAFVTIYVYGRFKATKKINGWTIMLKSGESGNGILLPRRPHPDVSRPGKCAAGGNVLDNFC